MRGGDIDRYGAASRDPLCLGLLLLRGSRVNKTDILGLTDKRFFAVVSVALIAEVLGLRI